MVIPAQSSNSHCHPRSRDTFRQNAAVELCQSKGVNPFQNDDSIELLLMRCNHLIRCNCGTSPLTPLQTGVYSFYIYRLGVQRLRTLQEKKSAQAKAARRDIALLLEKGKVETARIKVENSKRCVFLRILNQLSTNLCDKVIHEDIYVELLELLELYCELLIARFGLLDQE